MSTSEEDPSSKKAKKRCRRIVKSNKHKHRSLKKKHKRRHIRDISSSSDSSTSDSDKEEGELLSEGDGEAEQEVKVDRFFKAEMFPRMLAKVTRELKLVPPDQT